MLKLITIIVGAYLIPLAAWRLVGARRHRDPLLLPVLILAIGFTIGGIAHAITIGGLNWKLGVGLVAASSAARRWGALPPREPVE
jgi:high-affinity K+ transport system ATPase subunit B